MLFTKMSAVLFVNSKFFVSKRLFSLRANDYGESGLTIICYCKGSFFLRLFSFRAKGLGTV